MFGGIAIVRNLLCLGHTEASSRVFLVDVEDGRLVSTFGCRAAGFTDAGGVAMDSAFSIYVADTRNDVVRRFTAFGRQVATFGESVDAGPGAARRDRIGVLDRPRAVAVGDKVLWVACGERKLIRGVQRFDAATGAPLGALRAFGEEDRRFGAPRGLGLAGDEILVADTLHGVVQRFNLAGRYVGHVGVARDPGEVSRPVAVLCLAGGDLLVADVGDRAGIRRCALDGSERPLPAWPPATFDEPTALAADDRGRVYVLDRHGERVQRLHPDLAYDGVVVDLAEILYT